MRVRKDPIRSLRGVTKGPLLCQHQCRLRHTTNTNSRALTCELQRRLGATTATSSFPPTAPARTRTLVGGRTSSVEAAFESLLARTEPAFLLYCPNRTLFPFLSSVSVSVRVPLSSVPLTLSLSVFSVAVSLCLPRSSRLRATYTRKMCSATTRGTTATTTKDENIVVGRG